MPETSSKEENYHPSIVGNTFMRQYYQLLAKEPQSLHRFYKDESRWSHTNGSQMQEPIAGQKAINEQILKRGYAGARVDLDIGSIDCQASHSGGVFVLVTGVMTLVDNIVPKPFVQTFFLATQPKGYFVLNDCLRFLELPGASPASLAAAESAAAPAAPAAAVKDAKKPQAAIGTPVSQSPAAKSAKLPVSPVKTAAPAAAASTPVAKKEKTSASPAAKASPAPAAAPAAVAAPLSPVKVKTPVVQSPVKTAAPKSAPRDASPVKKTAAAPAAVAADKPVSPAAIASPKAAAAPAVLSPKPVKAAEPKPTPVPAAPTSWASLFSAAVTPSAPASTGAPKTAPALAAVATAAVAASGAAPAKAAPAASPKTAKSPSGDAAGAPKEKEKTRYHSVYIKEVPAQTKESDLRDLFKGFGAIANVNVVGTRGYAFVDFYEQESMRAALAESNNFKLFDKTLIVDERTDRKDQRSGFRGDAPTRGGRSGGRGPGPKGRTGGDRKERDESKGERRAAGENGASGNGNAGRGSNSNGSAAPRSDRREKSGRRGGKVESGSSARAE